MPERDEFFRQDSPPVYSFPLQRDRARTTSRVGQFLLLNFFIVSTFYELSKFLIEG